LLLCWVISFDAASGCHSYRGRGLFCFGRTWISRCGSVHFATPSSILATCMALEWCVHARPKALPQESPHAGRQRARVELRPAVGGALEAVAGTRQRHLTGRRRCKTKRYLGHVLVAMGVPPECNSSAIVVTAECAIASFFLCDPHQACNLSLALRELAHGSMKHMIAGRPWSSSWI